MISEVTNEDNMLMMARYPDNYFDLAIVVIRKIDHQNNRIKAEDCRSFINCTERMLMYSNDTLNLTSCIYHIRDYIRSEILRTKGNIVYSDINKALGVAFNGGGVASACLSLKKSEPAMITADMYDKLRKWLNHGSNIYFLNKEYEFLRQEYEFSRRPFNTIDQFKMDVLNFYSQSHQTGKYDHDTVKPEKQTRYLISACSNPGALVLVPFAGSGTECAMAAKEGRKFIGYDINDKYCRIANDRVDEILKQPQLF